MNLSSVIRQTDSRLTMVCVRAFILILALLFQTVPGYCTTSIIRFESDRILIAADNRRVHETPDGKQDVFLDDDCKISYFGHSAVTMMGMSTYDGGADAGQNWSAFEDAKNTYISSGEDLNNLANNWALKEAAFFRRHYVTEPNTVAALAQISPIRSLIDAFFVGWINGSPQLVIRDIVFDPSSAHLDSRISFITGTLPLAADGISYTSNTLTQELIDGKTDRGVKAAKQWDDESKKYPETERSWRQLQFLIRETSKIDSEVSPQSDILAIPLRGAPYWITQSQCK